MSRTDIGPASKRAGRGGVLWNVLQVRPAEVEQIQRTMLASALIGLGLVFFFSSSNALFLDAVGADSLPWVYITNAPLVIAAGLGYAWFSRRLPTAVVLQGSIWFLSASIAALWLWASSTDGQAAPFALAVWYRFLFIFGFLALWELTSAMFDVRQSKRLLPAVAVGAMAAFMVGGALVGPITVFIGTVHLVALSACCFALYGLAFARAMAGISFDAADAGSPATPREIVSTRFSQNLAAMRCITILLVFVTEFIFYDQVAENISNDENIARFLGIFLAVSTLTMVICTAVVSAKYVARYGVGVGLASMPAGLAILAVLLGVYGLVFGINFGFFVLAVFINLANMVLANAIETPVGAMVYQPMPVERRMAVRVAVDGWLGSVALLVAGLLLLAFDAFAFSNVLPFVWLLVAIGLVGIWLARRLYEDYRQALVEATTAAFSGSGASTELLEDLTEPLARVLPDLANSADPAVAVLAIEALAASGDSAAASQLAAIASDPERPGEVRSQALLGLSSMDSPAALSVVRAAPGAAGDDFAVATLAVGLSLDPSGPEAERVQTLSQSTDTADRLTAARSLSAAASDSTLDQPLSAAVQKLADDPDHAVRVQALRAAGHRLTPELTRQLINAGRQPDYRRPAIEALATGGAETIDLLGEAISDLPEPYVVDLVDHVYAPNTRRPVVLHRFLEPTATSSIRRAGFDAARVADVSLPADINRLLRDDVEYARFLLDLWHELHAPATDTPTFPLVADVLRDEFQAARRAMWAGLRLVANSSRVAELEQLASRPEDETRANTIEALDNLLPQVTTKLVLPILEPTTIADAAELHPQETPHPDLASLLEQLRDSPRTMASTRTLIHHHLHPKADDTTMSETIERVIALKRVDIFSTLPYEVLAELGTIASKQEASEGTEIIAEGAFGDELFALTAGEVRVDRSSGASTSLSAGTVFGELAVLDPGPRSATVVATTPCELLVVARPMLLALTERRPDVMAEIARVLAARLRNSPA